MNSVLHWKKSIFSKLSSIHSAEGEIGYLEEHPWKQTAEGEVNNRKYGFRSRGFLNQVTEIYDPTTNYSVGEIKYNAWMNKATITYLGQEFFWEYDNLWQTRWNIADANGNRVYFQGSLQKGSIEGAHISEFLILSGLFVTNYYSQATIAILVAIFVPLFATTTR